MFKRKNKSFGKKLVEITIRFPDGKVREIEGNMTPEAVNSILRNPKYKNTVQIVTWKNGI